MTETSTAEFNPIFVHASPRSGSTYFFNVLRRNESLMCFNEAIIDVFGYYGKAGAARHKASQRWNVNHDFLERNDFDEFFEAWNSVMHLYPAFPSFRDYLPHDGVLSAELKAYLAGLMKYARSHDKRPALCEIHSRGRVGAIRDAFGGFHIAQIRDPLSQFGSFVRPVIEGGQWGFLTFPLQELGISGAHPLYRIVPTVWRVPVLPWPPENGAQRWSSAIQYIAMVASPLPDTIEQAFRWHLFSWFLSNLAAICYSDCVLDIDRAHDDAQYRHAIIDTFASAIGIAPDFKDLRKFPRFYDFEALDSAAVCNQVTSTIKQALQDSRLEDAVCTLGKGKPMIRPATAAELLFAKLDASLSCLAESGPRRRIGIAEWKHIADKHKRIWFDPRMRSIGQRIYPFTAPVVQAARRAGIWQ